MKFLFKRLTKDGKVPSQLTTVISGLLSRLIKEQQKLADWLQIKSERISIKCKWGALILFCIIGLASIMNLVYGSFRSVHKTKLSITRIKPSIQLEPISRRDCAISKKEYDKLLDFQVYMDSLARSPTGKKQKERMLQNHSGLMDSIQTLMKFYENQN